MTNEEKAQKWDEIVVAMWNVAQGYDPICKAVVVHLLKEWNIFGPNGEDPSSL